MAKGSDASRVWFITGCSSGLGRALAERVLQRGQRCVATARDPRRLADFAAPHTGRALTLALDVRDAHAIDAAVAQAETTFGAIDVLVNNAGHGYLAAIEEGEDSVVRAMFDVNFFGVAALVRRVLPMMRRRGRGHVINISSVGGFVGNPASGYYNATKFAVEGLSEALAKEVAPLGIRVSIIEPGPFRTDFFGRSAVVARQPIDAYAATAGARRTQLLRRSGLQPGDPVRIADAIIAVADAPDPPLHLVLGQDALLRVRAKLDEWQRSIARWEAVTSATDFPPDEAGEAPHA